MIKACRKCGDVKAFSDFPKAAAAKHGIHTICKLCYKEYHKRHYREVTQKKRAQHLKRYWPGSTPEEAIAKYNLMFQAQSGKCAVCERHQSDFKDSLSVDHNHHTGIVRGLLCDNCNFALGRLGSDVGNEIILRAAEYIARR